MNSITTPRIRPFRKDRAFIRNFDSPVLHHHQLSRTRKQLEKVRKNNGDLIHILAYTGDYRDLLIKYIYHVSNIEGISFIDRSVFSSHDYELTEKEREVLRQLELEANQLNY